MSAVSMSLIIIIISIRANAYIICLPSRYISDMGYIYTDTLPVSNSIFFIILFHVISHYTYFLDLNCFVGV